MFTSAAHALDDVWPGVIPGLPPAVSYAIAAVHPPVPGERAEAGRPRAEMAQTVIDGGWSPSPPGLAGCRRLHCRYERKAEHFLAFTSLACTLVERR